MNAAASEARVAERERDAALVRRVLNGERQAYARLVQLHQDAIYRHLRGMGIDHDTAVDLVQDAFVKAWQRLGDCRDGTSFRAWLYRIARNLCLDHLKNVRRRDVPLGAVDTSTVLEDERARPADLTLTLRAALDRLAPPMREAFLLRHDAGYTYDEIAALTNTSVSAAKMRVHRARETLREFLLEQGVRAA